MRVLIRRFIYIGILYLDKFFLRQNPGIFILCYHSIAHDNWFYTVTPDDFKNQIDYLLQRYNPITLRDVEEYLRGIKKPERDSFVITFDDGYQDVMSIKDFCAVKGLKPAVFVLSRPDEADRRELATDRPLMTKDQLMELNKAGWIIGSHGTVHSDYSFGNRLKISEEIIQSKKELEGQLGLPINYFAFPKGVYTAEMLETVKRGKYLLGLSMDNNFISPGINKYCIPRVGVNRSHTILEFKSIFLPASVRFRKFITDHIGVINYD